jgi:hypothetical protein
MDAKAATRAEFEQERLARGNWDEPVRFEDLADEGED